MSKELKQSLKLGSLSGLLSASCCTIPFLLMIFGLSAASAGSLNTYLSGLRWSILIPIGLLSAAYGI